MADKTIRVNLVLPRSLWRDLALAAARANKSRAEFVRLSLAAVCEAKRTPVAIPPQQPQIDTSGLMVQRTPAQERPATAQEALEYQMVYEHSGGATTLAQFRVDRHWLKERYGDEWPTLEARVPQAAESPEELTQEETPFDPDADYASWRERGDDAATAFERTQYECKLRGITDWLPIVEDDVDGPETVQ